MRQKSEWKHEKKIFQSEGKQRVNNVKGRLIRNGLKCNMKLGAYNYLE